MNKHWTTDPPEIGKHYWHTRERFGRFDVVARVSGSPVVRDCWRIGVNEIRSIEPIPGPPPIPSLTDFPLPENHPYVHPIPDYGEVFTVEEWRKSLLCGSYCSYDGSGYPAKNGKMNRNGDVFPPPVDATHVVWFNK